MTEHLCTETVNIMRYTESAGFEGEIEWRIDPENGAWVRFEDVWPEITQLRARVRELEAGQFNAMLHLRFDDPEGAQTSLRDSLKG